MIRREAKLSIRPRRLSRSLRLLHARSRFLSFTNEVNPLGIAAILLPPAVRVVKFFQSDMSGIKCILFSIILRTSIDGKPIVSLSVILVKALQETSKYRSEGSKLMS